MGAVDSSREQGIFNPMHNLFFSFVLCAAGAGLCYLVMSLMHVEQSTAVKVASGFFAAVPQVREALDKHRAASRPSSEPPQIASFGDYDVKPSRAILYATLIGLVVVNLSSFFAGAMTQDIGVSKDAYTKVLGIFTLAWSLPALFFIGRWIGQRCSRHGALIALASSLSICLIGIAFDFVVLSDEAYFAMHEAEKSAAEFMQRIGMGVGAIFIVMICGFLVGRRRRLSKYLSYLLGQLKPASRMAIVDMAYAETLEKTRGAKWRPSMPEARPTARGYVLGVSGIYAGCRFPVRDELVFGRDPKQCSVVFPPEADGISGRHCALRFDGATGRFTLRDLQSANGTFVGPHQPVEPDVPRTLLGGDEFHLHTAAQRFVVRVEE